ncbi:MAG: RluA family pseudouridine synthase [candidate division KSB1 bacterium]|nr:RluA family pseudouridine synthase [candidate division KSB1 bacterium]MDZ7295277.1 RluA family pseudouridine synthase [candidate division KSB1 bacterium]
MTRARLNVLFADQAVLAVDKPPGLLTIPDRWDPHRPNLLAMLRTAYPGESILPVHRLDEGTSGVVLFARNRDAHRALCLQLQQRSARKTYFAIVSGEVREGGTISLALAPDPHHRGRMAVRLGGKESLSEYQVEECFQGYTLLRVVPHTGRMHQIRVHLRAIGHPLAVDPVYGGRSAIFLSELKAHYKRKADQEERPLLARLALHAAELSFVSPCSGEVTVCAPFPKDFRALLHALRKYRPLRETPNGWDKHQ